MPLEFHKDAIVLSGRTGTFVKTAVLGKYYDFWQQIVSGGKRNNYRFRSTIVELNAGTGEIYVEDEDEIILGSAGHALDLKFNEKNVDRSSKLNILLVEEHPECFNKLINVIKRRWPKCTLIETFLNDSKRILIGKDGVLIFNSIRDQLYEQLFSFERVLIFFDPLGAAKWETIEDMAKRRIQSPFQSGTEFLIFLFTSDWIKGRKGFSALPRIKDRTKWTKMEKKTVLEANKVFPDDEWLEILNNQKQPNELEISLVEYYKSKLQNWFRFVIPLPFKPKIEERYDLFFCTNYSVGANLIQRFYLDMLSEYGNIDKIPFVIPNANRIYPLFVSLYPELIESLPNRRIRPMKWKILWQIIKNHPEGICDQFCEKLLEHASDHHPRTLETVLNWLFKENLLVKIPNIDWKWNVPIFNCYRLNWQRIEKLLGISKPQPFQPLTPNIDK